MNVQIFQNRIEQKEGEDIGVVTLPSYNIRLSKLEDDKYKVRMSEKENDTDLFENDKDIRFEIHFKDNVVTTNDAGEEEEKGSMTGLFFFNGTRGWYIDSSEVVNGMDIIMSIGRMITKRFQDGMMKSIFERANG